MNGEEFNAPIIFSDGESFGSKNHKHLNDSADTHPPTDSIKKEHQTYNPPIKPMATTSSCETPTYLGESSGSHIRSAITPNSDETQNKSGQVKNSKKSNQ